MCGVSQKIEGEKEVEAIFLDFNKAFDKVDHMKLPYNLDRIGVSKRVRNWVQTLLVGHSQTVVADGSESSSCPDVMSDTVPYLYQ